MSATFTGTGNREPENKGSAVSKSLSLGPGAGRAVVGTSLIVLLVELGHSGVLTQYKDFISPFVAWGPGLLIFAAFAWLAHSYAPPLIASHQSMAVAVQKLADTVGHNANQQQDLVLAMQVNSDKIERMNTTLVEIRAVMGQKRGTNAG